MIEQQGVTLRCQKLMFDRPDRVIHAEEKVRVMRGEDPGSIPFEPTTALSLIINLPAAEAAGLTLPPDVLAEAARVIKD